MELWIELLTSWIGILSLSVIVFIIGMAAFFIAFFVRKSREPGDGQPDLGSERIPGSQRHPGHSQ
ncbi:uncharacterized protein DUF3149 [Alkalispirillum mobile]|uniref:Uncharacterized protein DUF3149 n=1 Tax=Alkalispirillum mobile TaxID=85925 RepID=A0A498C6I7_9GAMM|nr:DUF3149 domain-containing protein [Alkalispirillum mobile]RLK50679.1 uncharacterized protein DUF3149 [Alkalispirillum mobile]